jgi:4-carboxymuconolactone decarboxylase
MVNDGLISLPRAGTALPRFDEPSRSLLELNMSGKRERALEVLKQMSPPADANAAPPPQLGFAREMSDILMTNCMEGLWARDGLDLRTRSLINVAILITQRDHGPLSFHAPAAIRNGATVAELEEVIYHTAGYSGFPAAVTAREVITEALTKAGMIG